MKFLMIFFSTFGNIAIFLTSLLNSHSGFPPSDQNCFEFWKISWPLSGWGVWSAIIAILKNTFEIWWYDWAFVHKWIIEASKYRAMIFQANSYCWKFDVSLTIITIFKRNCRANGLRDEFSQCLITKIKIDTFTDIALFLWIRAYYIRIMWIGGILSSNEIPYRYYDTLYWKIN